MSEALAAIYPATTLHTCIVHLLRYSLDFANWMERKPLRTALRPIYTAASAEAASVAWTISSAVRGVGSFRRWSRLLSAVAISFSPSCGDQTARITALQSIRESTASSRSYQDPSPA